MNATNLRIALCDIDSGRWDDIIHALRIVDECAQCDHFNLSISDPRQGYRCKCAPYCIAATLNPALIKYFNINLGWINE